jgi:hypothetical protein
VLELLINKWLEDITIPLLSAPSSMGIICSGHILYDFFSCIVRYSPKCPQGHWVFFGRVVGQGVIHSIITPIATMIVDFETALDMNSGG